MPQIVFDVVVSDPLFARLPVNVDQRASRSSGIIMLLLLVPALALLMMPVGLLLASSTPMFSAAADNPTAAAQVLVGLGLWTVLFVVPAKRVVQRFGRARKIRIDEGVVTVTEESAVRSLVWSAPISDFSGLAHHVRSTLSGLRHELILVHRDRAKSVLLHAAGHISEATIERAATLLELPQVPAGVLYRFGQPRRPAMASPQPQSQAA